MPFLGKKLIKTLSSPYFISLVLSVPLCIFLSFYFPYYRLKLNSSETIGKKNGVIYYYDINKDGYSEEILSFTDNKGSAAYKITNYQGKIINSGEYNGTFPFTGTRLIIDDYDKDGYPEIFGFYVRQDTLFLSATEFAKEKVEIIKDRFITNLRNDLGVIDCDIRDCGLQDLENDGSLEIIFSVMAGFPVFPRNIFHYNIGTDSLIVSPFIGAIGFIAEVWDLDRDGKKEIFLNSYAPGNMKGWNFDGLIDTSAWLVVLDNRLNFKFRPYEFTGYTSGIGIEPFTRDNRGFIGAVVERKSLSNSYIDICIFDEKGKLLRNKTFADTVKGNSLKPIVTEFYKNSLIIIDQKGNLYQYDQHFNLLFKERRNLAAKWNYFFTSDLDWDGEKEIIFYSGKGEVVVTRNDLSSPVKVMIPAELGLLNTDIKENGPDLPEIALQSERNLFLLNYQKNPYYFWQYLLYIGIFVTFYLINFLVIYFQRKLLQDKYDAEKKISELQLMMVKDQLDPHFIFNAMNTINSLVILKKPEEAQQRIISLSRLMKTMIESSGKIAQPIEKEIDFTRSYLDFQQKRYGDLFSYNIDIEKDVDPAWQVPRMVLQIPVENAIKHGLIPKGKDGLIRIEVKKDSADIVIVLEDNGIGREEAGKRVTGSTGKGLSILQQNFEILNRYNKERIKFEIHDLQSSAGGVTGTKICITIPVNLNYKIYER